MDMDLKIFIWKTEQQVILEIDMYFFFFQRIGPHAVQKYHKEVLKCV